MDSLVGWYPETATGWTKDDEAGKAIRPVEVSETVKDLRDRVEAIEREIEQIKIAGIAQR